MSIRVRSNVARTWPAHLSGQTGRVVRIAGTHATYGDPATVEVRWFDGSGSDVVHVDNLSELPTVITNGVPRDVIDAWDLSESEREQFDYLDWSAIERGEDSASFFRYRGATYDLGEFSADYGITRGTGLPAHLSQWDGYAADSFFSATVVRFVDDGQRVVVGTVLT